MEVEMHQKALQAAEREICSPISPHPAYGPTINGNPGSINIRFIHNVATIPRPTRIIVTVGFLNPGLTCMNYTPPTVSCSAMPSLAIKGASTRTTHARGPILAVVVQPEDPARPGNTPCPLRGCWLVLVGGMAPSGKTSLIDLGSSSDGLSGLWDVFNVFPGYSDQVTFLTWGSLNVNK